MNEDFLIFYKRWLEKAGEYTDSLTDCFDKFVTLFILFNSQYNYLAEEDGEMDKGDKYKATEYIKQYLGSEGFCENTIIKKESSKIIELIQDGEFYLKDERIDAELVKKVSSSNHEEKTKGILEIIYFVRCNLFHGQKSFTEDQKRLLLPCIVILEEINKIVFNSIDAKI